ncbi:MAG: hypothetical protein A2284_07065 [Deltaproteobacteria bacterium RIFOXYA12_FULL_61_11]|nr:MAG: hypothetical protein A2284_07065 [Deltaproteobacteria bacterium RIFOXYA12_FULL_61_11]
MPRPFHSRRVAGRPAAAIFKPIGIPVAELEEVVMTLDEFEALRLADLGELYQELAAVEMGVSRPTFSRIIESAHRKVADVLVHGKALRIEGGPVLPHGHRCCRLHDGTREAQETQGDRGAPRSGVTRAEGRGPAEKNLTSKE